MYTACLQLKCYREKSGNLDSKVHAALAGRVNLSVVDALTGTEIQTRDARIAGVIAETWNKNIASKISIISSLTDDVQRPGDEPLPLARQLAIAAFSPSYGMQIRIEQAELIMIYG